MLTEGPPVHRTHTTVDSPVGPLTLVSAGGVLSGLYLDRQRYRPPAEIFGEPDDTAFGQVMDQLAEYFAGKRNEFSVPVSLSGTRFQRTVWTALRDIPYGETISYGELAARIGRPAAARAVGLANGKNPVSIIVPCHRVVGSTGDLTGYGGGLSRKQYLLDLEQRTALCLPAPALRARPRSALLAPALCARPRATPLTRMQNAASNRARS